MDASDKKTCFARHARLAGPGLLLALFCAATVPAATVYKTVDKNGVVSYSDTPPADNVAVETLVIDVRATEPSESVQEQLEAMRETTDRMVADRQQREQHRAQLRQSQAASEPQPQVIQYSAPAAVIGSFPVYYPVPVCRHGRGCQTWPVHPVVRPPLRPKQPGHDYPASLIRRGYSPEVRAAFEN